MLCPPCTISSSCCAGIQEEQLWVWPVLILSNYLGLRCISASIPLGFILLALTVLSPSIFMPPPIYCMSQPHVGTIIGR